MSFRFLINSIFLLFVFAANAQFFSIEGNVKDKKNNEPLPYASITLKKSRLGTISNENGQFEMYIPERVMSDTLVVTYIGFDNYEIPVKIIKNSIEITLTEANNVLDEVLITKLSPLDYIELARENMALNAPQAPFSTTAYYREKFIENNAIINKHEGVFRSYYKSFQDSAKSEHQLLLYRPEENPQQFKFMREWLDKKREKSKKRAQKKGEEWEDEWDEDSFKMDFGGPESVLDIDIYHDNDANFLNPKHYSKYEYSFGDETVLNGEPLMTIVFKAKKSIDYIRDSGTILISRDTYAIVQVEQKGKFAIPFLVKPILFAVGLKIANPRFTKTITYQKYENQWFPQLFRWDANVILEKRKSFDKNEEANINIGQVFSVIEFNQQASPIEPSKKFDPGKEMPEQVFNDDGLIWNNINVVKD
ncbi:carboxypeptidase-like regulatory domain-containing protein [Namhaeicola litoreus]|uniref:carboxypeptidase-like regulatory domain-containing protein n=1 Tax=Namhaeicola litoreus TaxID=1052145 RepID=UPI0036712710